MSTTLILAAIGVLVGSGGVGALINARRTNHKITAEARKLGVEADDVLLGRALEMYEKALAAAERAEQRAEQLGREVRALHDHVDRLERIMRDADLDPPAFLWPSGGAATS